MIDAAAEAGDQLQAFRRKVNEGRVDLIRHGRHQHVALRHRPGQRRAVHGHVADIEHSVEQFRHPCLDIGRQAACHDDARLGGTRFLGHDQPLFLAMAVVKRLWHGAKTMVVGRIGPTL